MEKRNNILEKMLIIAVIILVIVLAIFIIYQINKDDEQNSFGETVQEKKEELDITEAQALEVGSELYKYAMKTYWKQDIGLWNNVEGNEEIIPLVPVTTVINGIEYYNTITYEDSIASKFTEKGQKDFIEYLDIIQQDGKYYVPVTDRGANIYYVDTNLEIVSMSNDEIKFNAVSSYNTENEVGEPTEEIETRSEVFVIKKENEIWKIDVFVLPN